MSQALNQQEFIIPAGTPGAPNVFVLELGGSFFFIQKASAPFQMQFDASSKFKVLKSGYKFGKKFEKITFFNETANDIYVVVEVGDVGVGFDGADETKDAATYPKGSLGIFDAASLGAFVNGYISAVRLAGGPGSGGNGYAVGNILTVPGGTGTAATIRVDSVTATGKITGYSLQNPGAYSVMPGASVSPTGGSGSGSSFLLTKVNPIANMAFNADKTLTLASPGSIVIPNFDGANRRKKIIFHAISGTLRVIDSNGGLFRMITVGNVEEHDDSGLFTIDGNGSNVTFVIGETYYA